MAACVYPAEVSNSKTVQTQCRILDGIIMQQPCASAMRAAEEHTGTAPVLLQYGCTASPESPGGAISICVPSFE